MYIYKNIKIEQMELELKHIAPYLPYGLKAKNCFNEISEIKGLQYGNESCRNELWTFIKNKDYLQGYLYECKPILRPLSDLKKEITHNEEKFIPIHKYNLVKDEDGVWCEEFDAFYSESPKSQIPVDWFNWWLFEYHFDVFGLIEAGLAIDINTLYE